MDKLADLLKSAKPKEQELQDLSGQFYTQIPHRIGRSKADINKAVIRDLKTVEQKQEVLQLMRDMLQVIKHLKKIKIKIKIKGQL